MAEKRITRLDQNLYLEAGLMFGTVAFTAATDTVNTWATSGAPVLSTGIAFLTVTCGASTYKIPAWSTT